MSGTEIVIPAAHPAFAGHFPGMPVLPGALLLDAALHAIGALRGLEPSAWRIGSAKFQNPLRPGEPLCLEHQPLANGSISFTLHSAGRLVASGLLQPQGGDGAA